MVEVIIDREIALWLKPSIEAIIGSAVARAHVLVCASSLHVHCIEVEQRCAIREEYRVLVRAVGGLMFALALVFSCASDNYCHIVGFTLWTHV